MAKTIKVSLSRTEIKAAIRKIQKYKEGLLAKCETFAERLAEIGLQEAKVRISQSSLGNTISVSVKTEPFDNGCRAILVGVGQTQQPADGSFEPINTLIMVEFGAGITYNPTANPKAAEFGYGVGTYPGQTHAFDPNGWYYMGNDNKWHHSFGIKATMPMYGAAVEMGNNISKIAKEVFGND